MILVLNWISEQWKSFKWPLIIGFSTIIVRLVYYSLATPPLNWYDSAIYDTVAWNFVSGLGIYYTPGIPDAMREPGYALLILAPVYFIFGHSLLAAQITQAVLSAIICILIFFIGKRYLTKTAGIIGAMLYCVYPGVVTASGEIMTEVSFSLFLVASIYTYLRYRESNRAGWLFGSGLLLGITTLIRFVTFFFPPVLFLALLWPWDKNSLRKKMKDFLLFIVGFAVFVTPWFVWNYITLDKFVFGRTGGADIYWSGSYIPWDGDWQGYISPLSDFADEQTTTDYDSAMMERFKANLVADPLGVAVIWLKKPIKIYLQPEGLGFVLNKGAFNGSNALMTALAIIAFTGHILLIGLAIAGLLRYKKYPHYSRIFFPVLCYFIVVFLPLNGIPRYAVPIYPYLFLFSGVALEELWRDLTVRFKRQKPKLV